LKTFKARKASREFLEPAGPFGEGIVLGNLSLFSDFEKAFLAFSCLLNLYLHSDLPIEVLFTLVFHLRAL